MSKAMDASCLGAMEKWVAFGRIYRCQGGGSSIPASGVGSPVSQLLRKVRKFAHEFRREQLRSFPLHDSPTRRGLRPEMMLLIRGRANFRQRRKRQFHRG